LTYKTSDIRKYTQHFYQSKKGGIITVNWFNLWMCIFSSSRFQN